MTMPKLNRPSLRLIPISFVAKSFKAFASVLRLRQKNKALRKDSLSHVDIDNGKELDRQHAMDHTVDFIQSMYGQDFGLRRLAKEISHNEKLPLIGIAREKVITTLVTETSAASSDIAQRHFEDMLTFETDCWDVHESLKSPNLDFILVDVRGPALFKNGHVSGAVNIPHGKITSARMANYTKDKIYVVYCAGPHCNGANKAAVRLARLGFPVKMMIGGITGWLDEGFTLTDAGEAVR